MEAEPLTDLIGHLFQNYGITGLAFGGLLWLLWKNKKDADVRISQLEEQADSHQAQQIANYKEMIGEYVEIVKNNNEVLAKLTACLDGMGNTLTQLKLRRED
jgi:uncharacterized coiled-coil protein SlyX